MTRKQQTIQNNDNRKQGLPEDSTTEGSVELGNQANSHDSGWKQIVRKFFYEFLAFYFPVVWNLLDTTVAPDFLDKELVSLYPKARVTHRYADLLVSVRSKSGNLQIVFCHLEIQGSPDKRLPRRMFEYFYKIYDITSEFPVSLVLLTDDNPAYLPAAFEYSSHGIVNFKLEIQVAKGLHYLDRLEQLKDGTGIFEQVTAVYLEHQLERKRIRKLRRLRETAAQGSLGDKSRMETPVQLWLDFKVRLMKRLFEKGFEEERISSLLLFLDWLVQLPKPFHRQYFQEMIDYSKEKNMAFVPTWEAVGIEKGLEIGKKEGKKEGRILGVYSAEQKVLIRQLSRKFKLTVDDRTLIKKITDTDLLEAALDEIITAENKQQVMEKLLGD